MPPLCTSTAHLAPAGIPVSDPLLHMSPDTLTNSRDSCGMGTSGSTQGHAIKSRWPMVQQPQQNYHWPPQKSTLAFMQIRSVPKPERVPMDSRKLTRLGLVSVQMEGGSWMRAVTKVNKTPRNKAGRSRRPNRVWIACICNMAAGPWVPAEQEPGPAQSAFPQILRRAWPSVQSRGWSDAISKAVHRPCLDL